MTTNQMLLFDTKSDMSTGFIKICQELDLSFDQPGWPDSFGEALRKRIIDTKKTSIRTLSLFTGAGGLDIGFHDVGFDICSMIEIDKRFISTLEFNTGLNSYLNCSKACCIDVRDFDPSKLGKIDFIIGGPPCQTFSAAGRRAAGVQGIEDTRGTLFEEYVRILKALKPYGFLFENVYGITGAQNGHAFQLIKKRFEEAGYSVSYRVLDAADFGVPQHRERLFIFGCNSTQLNLPVPTHGPDSPNKLPFYSAGLAVKGVPVTIEEANATVNGRFGPLLNEIPPGLNYSFFTEKLGHPTPIFAWRSKFSDFLYKADPNTPIRTLKAQGGQYTGPFHWDNRPFSTGELKRLQTFPDCYVIQGSRQTVIHQIGNSVPPQLARILALSVRQQLFREESSLDSLPLLHPSVALGFRKRKRSLTSIYKRKAKEAIASLAKINIKKANSRNYYGLLGEGFSWSEIQGSPDKEQYAVSVEFRATKNTWRFNVGDNNITNCGFTIRVFPDVKQGWALPVSEVFLKGALTDTNIFTATWKAFERELINAHIKADLVQLCEYYQYPPRFFANMKIENQPKYNSYWQALKYVVSGYGVRRIIESNELGKELKIMKSQIPEFAQFLRSLGYEIRNRETNPQIPAGSYLIPYVFPTLTPLSVQLRKSLGE